MKTAKDFLKDKGIKDTLYNVEYTEVNGEIDGELKWIKGGLSKLLDEYAHSSGDRGRKEWPSDKAMEEKLKETFTMEIGVKGNDFEMHLDYSEFFTWLKSQMNQEKKSNM